MKMTSQQIENINKEIEIIKKKIDRIEILKLKSIKAEKKKSLEGLKSIFQQA